MNNKKCLVELSSFFDFALTSNSLKSEKDICTHLLLTVMGHFGVSKGKVSIKFGNKVFAKGKFKEGMELLSFPLTFNNENLGELTIEKKELLKNDRQFILSLCALTSAFLKNAIGIKELKNANRDLSRKIFQINSVFEISRELLLLKNIKEAASLCLNVLAGQLLIKNMLIAVKDKKGEIKTYSRNIKLTEKLNSCSDIKNHPLVQEVINVGDNITLAIGDKFNNQKITEGDKEFATILLNFLSISIDNIFMIKDLIEKEKLAREVKIARSIQQRLLPQTLPNVNGVEISPAMVTFGEVGGDYYDVVKLSDTLLLFVIADVTGKGVPASLIMSAVQSALKTLILYGERNLETIVSNINAILAETTEGNKFVTMFIGIVDTKNMLLTSINAGHNPPILISAKGETKQLKKGGMVLGLFEGIQYQTEVTKLEKGDTVFLYTDGLTEAENNLNEEFGMDNLIETVKEARSKPCQVLTKDIIETISEFSGHNFNDDLTLLCLKIF
jgi:sigma-B regulation protein RsbU (phosphoserine phosphatase)